MTLALSPAEIMFNTQAQMKAIYDQAQMKAIYDQ